MSKCRERSATSRAHLTLSLLPLKESLVPWSQALIKSDGNKAVREETLEPVGRFHGWRILFVTLADGSDQLTGGRRRCKDSDAGRRGYGRYSIRPSSFRESENVPAKIRCFCVVSRGLGRVETLICWDII